MTDWQPACMDEAELAEYRAGVLVGCRDCTETFANEMRAEGRCNGSPGEVLAGIGAEEPEMEEPINLATRRVAVEVTAPCDTCIHAGICRIQPTLVELRRLAVSLPTVDEAVSVELAADVSCAHYVKARGVKAAAAPKLVTTPDKDERRSRILEAVERHGGDVTAAAAELGELPHVVARIRNASQRQAVPA